MNTTVSAALLAGVVAGFGIAMPVGAISTLIALLAANRGWRVGAAAGLGAATVDGLYATVALAFGAALAPVLTAWRTPMRWVAAAVLIVIAVSLLRPAWRRTADAPPAPAAPLDRPHAGQQPAPSVAAATVATAATSAPEVTSAPEATEAAEATGTARATTPGRAYVTFFGLTAINPATVVYFAALTTGGSARVAASPATGAAFVAGALAASAIWQLVVASAGHGAGRALTGPRGRRWTAIVGAAIVAALAVHTALGS